MYNTIIDLQDKIDVLPKTTIDIKVIAQTFKSVCSDFDFTLKNLQKQRIRAQNPRDKQMAENLTFLKYTYPKEKIIAWGASYHFANHLNQYEYTAVTEDYATKLHSLYDTIVGSNAPELKDEIADIKEIRFAKPMGEFLKDTFGDKLFSLAFTSYEGIFFDVFNEKVFPVPQPPTNSIEASFKKQGLSDNLLLLEDTKTKIYASVLGVHAFICKLEPNL